MKKPKVTKGWQALFDGIKKPVSIGTDGNLYRYICDTSRRGLVGENGSEDNLLSVPNNSAAKIRQNSEKSK